MTWTYHGKNKIRIVDFVVIAKSKADAELFVVKAVAKGVDSKGVDLTWMNKIPWDTVETVQSPPDESETGKAERHILGNGYVELR